jgi:hypothetical protein
MFGNSLKIVEKSKNRKCGLSGVLEMCTSQ